MIDFVIPAALNSGAGQAGIQRLPVRAQSRWIPASAGMTECGGFIGATAIT
jgi:hypothetical protein